MEKLSDGRIRGWWWAENDLFDQGWVAKMGSYAFACYALLMRRADGKGVSFPSLEDFMAMTGVSRSEVIRSIARLEDLGLVEIRRGGGSRGTNVYRLLPLPKDGEPVKVKQELKVHTDTHEPAAPLAFARAWALFTGVPSNSKQAAIRAWNARIKEGVDPEVLVRGAERYLAYCRAMKTEPQYIKRTATFFGPDRHYESDHTIPVKEAAPQQGGKPGPQQEDLMEFYEREQIIT